MLDLEPVQPRQLSGTLQLGWSRLGERQEVGRMPVVRLPPVSAVAQALERVLPDGLQQSEARLAVAHLRLHQAAVHQRAQRVHDVPGPARARRRSGGGADGLRGGQVEGSCKHP